MRPRLIDIPQICDPRGNLSYVEGKGHFPFEIMRVFWTYNVPSGQRRGGHAYKKQNELIVALSGAVDIITIDEKGRLREFRLDRPNIGLLVPPRTWRQMELFSGNTFCVHFSDSIYNIEDYDRSQRR
jgi:hypothetical protein